MGDISFPLPLILGARGVEQGRLSQSATTPQSVSILVHTQM
jgi:hypothetical protein